MLNLENIFQLDVFGN